MNENASTSSAISRHTSQKFGKHQRYDRWQHYKEDIKELKEDAKYLMREYEDKEREITALQNHSI